MQSTENGNAPTFQRKDFARTPKRSTVKERRLKSKSPARRRNNDSENLKYSTRKSRTQTSPPRELQTCCQVHSSSSPEFPPCQLPPNSPASEEIPDHSKKKTFLQNNCSLDFSIVHITIAALVLASGLAHGIGVVALLINQALVLTIINAGIYLAALVALLATSLALLAISHTAYAYLSSPKALTPIFCPIILAVVTVVLVFVFDSFQSSIYKELEPRLLSSINSDLEDDLFTVWDKFHYAYKCCGVRGFFDWCNKTASNMQSNGTQSDSFLGNVMCNVPESCCFYLRMNKTINTTIPCVNLLGNRSIPDLGKDYSGGCLIPISSEVQFKFIVYRVLSFTTAALLPLLAFIPANIGEHINCHKTEMKEVPLKPHTILLYVFAK